MRLQTIFVIAFVCIIRQWHVENALIFERYLGVDTSKTPVT